jgi:hypothetical protein
MVQTNLEDDRRKKTFAEKGHHSLKIWKLIQTKLPKKILLQSE